MVDRVALGSFLAVASDVEQGVVDADGHADEQNDRAEQVSGRHEEGRECRQSHCGRDRRQREQDRDTGGNKGAEHDQQDDQCDRDGDELRLGEVVLVHLIKSRADRRIPDLLDPQLGMRGRDLADNFLDIQRRVIDGSCDLVVGAGAPVQCHLDQQRRSVGRGDGLPDVSDASETVELISELRDSLSRCRHVDCAASRVLHQDGLGRHLTEVGVEQGEVCTGRGANGVVGLVGFLCCDRTTADDGCRHEGDPENEGGPPMASTPGRDCDDRATRRGAGKVCVDSGRVATSVGAAVMGSPWARLGQWSGHSVVAMRREHSRE